MPTSRVSSSDVKLRRPFLGRTRLFGLMLPLGLLALTLATALAAAWAGRAHRAAAERVLRDYAGVAGTEFIRRTAFDVGFNGFQAVAAAVRQGPSTGPLTLPPDLPRRARDLVARLFDVDESDSLASAGPPEFVAWIRSEASALPAEPDRFCVRRSFLSGHARTVVFVPRGRDAARLAAFEVAPLALVPFLQLSLNRGPLLPEVIGDGRASNDLLTLTFSDATGRVWFRSGPADRRGFEVAIPFGDYYRGVLEGSHVRVVLDPLIAGRLLPGGLPRSLAPFLALLVLAALTLTALSLRQARRERAFTALREDFVVSVSHDLRTPLAQIRLNLEGVLLGRSRSEAEQRRFLEASLRETLRLSHMVDNILDFSQPGQLSSGVPTRLLPLRALVDPVVEAFRPLAEARGILVRVTGDCGTSGAVHERAFAQALLNLLDNAIKYGPANSEVTVTVQDRGGASEVLVEDRGPGVPQGHRESIFEPFARLDRDRQSAATGAGIGLAIVRRLTSAQGGQCRVEERSGGGARFVLSFASSGKTS